MATKSYVDTLTTALDGAVTAIVNPTNSDSSLTAASSSMLNGITPLNANGQVITGLAAATSGTDALRRSTADSRYYAITSPLDWIEPPTAAVLMNSQKITGLGDATDITDALNRQTADSRYYSQSVALNAITAPSASVSLNSRKITNLADATAATDAINQ